jgi:hypothetical protein
MKMLIHQGGGVLVEMGEPTGVVGVRGAVHRVREGWGIVPSLLRPLSHQVGLPFQTDYPLTDLGTLLESLRSPASEIAEISPASRVAVDNVRGLCDYFPSH